MKITAVADSKAGLPDASYGHLPRPAEPAGRLSRQGDLPVLPGAWYSIELSIRRPVPEWGGKELFVGMEEEAQLGEDSRVRWTLERQEKYHLVR